jgi:hypothetical protein
MRDLLGPKILEPQIEAPPQQRMDVAYVRFALLPRCERGDLHVGMGEQ